jgi:hypothetical protein
MTKLLQPLPFVYDDGGRAAAGFSGTANDCVTRAIAIVTGKPYAEVYAKIDELGSQERKTKNRKRKSSARTGVFKPTYRRYLTELGYEFVPTMSIGSGCKVHLRKGELPSGRLIVNVSRHLVAVIDGVVHDNHDPTRGGTRCVYGYYRKP